MNRPGPVFDNAVKLQHAVVLGSGRIDEGLHLEGLDYSFTVHYLRDEPVGPLLADPHLAPFASLGDLPDDDQRRRTLARALELIATLADEPERTILAQAAADLAAVRLDPATINATWKESPMPVPSIFERVHEEGRELGREEVVTSLLRRRFGDDERIPRLAHRLARLSPDRYLDLIDQATSLDELASES